MKIITFGTLKGGTGKTTSAFNIASCLAEDYKVLLIDCDPQGNLSQDAGIDIADQDAISIKNVFESYMRPEQVRRKVQLGSFRTWISSSQIFG